TDAAAVFFLIHARGLRLRPRVGATLEVESGSNDPFAVLLTVILVEFLTVGDRSWQHVLSVLAEQAALGTLIGILGGHVIVIARPAAVFACLAPFRFAWREKAFISWVGLRGAVGIFLASIPLLIGLPNAHLYFDIAFVVVLTSLLIQGWTIAAAARELHIALPRHD